MTFPFAQPVGSDRHNEEPEQRGHQEQSTEKPQVPSPSAVRHGNPSPLFTQLILSLTETEISGSSENRQPIADHTRTRQSRQGQSRIHKSNRSREDRIGS